MGGRPSVSPMLFKCEVGERGVAEVERPHPGAFDYLLWPCVGFSERDADLPANGPGRLGGRFAEDLGECLPYQVPGSRSCCDRNL